jgi:hypothetical protein
LADIDDAPAAVGGQRSHDTAPMPPLSGENTRNGPHPRSPDPHPHPHPPRSPQSQSRPHGPASAGHRGEQGGNRDSARS